LFKCSFCRETDRRVLFGASIQCGIPPFALIALVTICNECVAEFAERLLREPGGSTATLRVVGLA
jgi:hypothetical protein